MKLLGHGGPVIEQVVMVLLPWCHLSTVDSKWEPKHFYEHCYCSELPSTTKLGRDAAHSSSDKMVAKSFLR